MVSFEQKEGSGGVEAVLGRGQKAQVPEMTAGAGAGRVGSSCRGEGGRPDLPASKVRVTLQ